MKTIVLSGINLREGGGLSVFRDFLAHLISLGYSRKNKIIALVSDKTLFEEFASDVVLCDFTKSKNCWLFRLYYEYIFFYSFSKKIKPYIWISMHDITPNVDVERRIVYCHNPSPFLKVKRNQIKYGFKTYLFSKFYIFLYGINLKKNAYVIVQQNWMREEFSKIYNLDRDKIIVSHPSIVNEEVNCVNNKVDCNTVCTFIFPSFPRFFKNFEVICDAVQKLNEMNVINFKVILTIDGTENNYSKHIVNKYNHLKNISFSGLLKREELFKIYGSTDCFIFPSKLETWGLPITEYRQTGKPMLLADLPYAHETIESYEKVRFFNPNDARKLATFMKEEIQGNAKYLSIKAEKVAEPYTRNWGELVERVITELSC